MEQMMEEMDRLKLIKCNKKRIKELILYIIDLEHKVNVLTYRNADEINDLRLELEKLKLENPIKNDYETIMKSEYTRNDEVPLEKKGYKLAKVYTYLYDGNVRFKELWAKEKQETRNNE